jgi:hypothetical protein
VAICVLSRCLGSAAVLTFQMVRPMLAKMMSGSASGPTASFLKASIMPIFTVPS